MTTAAETLCAIEERAERAIVQELRLMTNEVLQMRPSLNLEDRAYADGLLLKLGRLEMVQRAVSTADAAASALPMFDLPLPPAPVLAHQD